MRTFMKITAFLLMGQFILTAPLAFASVSSKQTFTLSVTIPPHITDTADFMNEFNDMDDLANFQDEKIILGENSTISFERFYRNERIVLVKTTTIK